MQGKKPGQIALVALLMALAILGAYLPAVSLEFTNYDDPYYVTENAHVQGGLSWEAVKWAVASTSTGNWHPLTWLSHMLDCQWFGLNPAGHHGTSLVFHAANAFLLLLLLFKLTGAVWRSGFVAALFALHPLHVESVAWISERKDVLSTFFGLLALLAYARYARGKEAHQRGSGSEPSAPSSRAGSDRSAGARSNGAYVLALLCLALGLMSKPMLVTWPFLMFLLDYWPLHRLQGPASQQNRDSFRRSWRLVVEKIPFLALTASSCVVTFCAQKAGGAVAPLAHIPLGQRMANAVESYVVYVRKLCWPSDLAVIYPYAGDKSAVTALFAFAVLVAATLLVIWQRKARPYLMTGWFWYLGTLVPVIGLVQVGNQAMADRYTYIPAIGLFIALAWGVAEFAGGNRVRQRLALSAGAASLVACAFLTQAQTVRWKNSETLFTHAVAVTGNNFIACNSLADHYLRRGRLNEAEQWYHSALEANSESPYAWNGLGRVALERGDFQKALTNCAMALRLDPQMAEGHSTLGMVFMKLGQSTNAIHHYREAVRLRPDYASAHYNLANALASQGQVTAARQHYEAASRLDPGSADAHNNLAYMLAREGRQDRAIAEYKAALKLNPVLWQAHYGLGVALSRQGRDREAAGHFRAAIAGQPNLTDALNRLAWILATCTDEDLRNGAEAVRLAEQACAATGRTQPALLLTLAAAYAEAGRFSDAVSSGEEARRIALAKGQQEIASRTEPLLECFRANRPYRQLSGPGSGSR